MATTQTRTTHLTTAADLGALIRQMRPDATAASIVITNDWCRDQMHDLGATRYEDVDADLAGAIADRVDELAQESAFTRREQMATQETFLIVLVPDREFRERHSGTINSATTRAAEWLADFNRSRTAAETRRQNAAEIYRISDFGNQTTYGEIVASKQSCQCVPAAHQRG